MKDPFVTEVRKYRMEHTKKFNFDIHAICNDLRKYQETLYLSSAINKNKVFTVTSGMERSEAYLQKPKKNNRVPNLTSSAVDFAGFSFLNFLANFSYLSFFCYFGVACKATDFSVR